MPSIFVFGSNLKGIHGAGAALYAKERWGAVQGVGEGRTGNSYALPTKHTPWRGMTLDEIRPGVERFLSYAKQNPELRFYVTRVGCGLAGYHETDIAPMFEHAPLNCLLPRGWRKDA